MRIIAGSARGRRILSVPKKMQTVRPISGRIRQSLFDILKPKLMACRFLDLFAGTGAVGLEALSRGAEAAVFVEMDRRCVDVIEKNIARAGWSGKAKVLRANVVGPLSWISHRGGVARFDLVFMGPPYKDEKKKPLNLTNGILSQLVAADLLEPTAWIVAQHHQKEVPSAPPGLRMFRQSKYGDSRLSFFQPFHDAHPPVAGESSGPAAPGPA